MRISDWSSDVCSSDLITEYGLNPLEVTTDPEFGGVRRRINSFIAMINRTTSKLGVRQEAVLRALLNDLYELNGYDQRNPRTWDPRKNPYVRGHSKRSEERSVGKEWVRKCRSRWWQYQ